MKLKKLNYQGFSHDILLVAFVMVFAIAGVGYLVSSHADPFPHGNPNNCTQFNITSLGDTGLQPLTDYVNPENSDHRFWLGRDDVNLAAFGYCYSSVDGYIYANQVKNSVPFYEYVSPKNGTHLYSVQPPSKFSKTSKDDLTMLRTVGYVTSPTAISTSNALEPLYRFYNPKLDTNYYSLNSSESTIPHGFTVAEGIQAYVWSEPPQDMLQP
jgi:hypothetical protein